MPKRPYRFEDFSRKGRYRLLEERPPPNQDDDNASSVSSEQEIEGDGMTDSGESGPALDDVDDMEVLEHEEDNIGEGFDVQNADQNPDAEYQDDDNEADDNEADDNEADDNEADDNEADDNEADDNEADDASEHGEGESDHEQEELQSDLEEDEEENINGNIPLYPGAPVTVGESVQMILSFALSHNLSGTCIGDLLQLVSLHCIQPHECLTSMYLFKKYLKNIDVPMRRHYYCAKCFIPIDEDNCNECQANNKNYFLTIPIIPQLRKMYGRERFNAKLRHRFERRKEYDDNFEDVYDGRIYQSQCRGDGYLADPNAISFCWNSDGVPVFKSSKYSIWPFFLCINELPYKDRVRKENIILAGLWFGDHKPIVNLFLLPLRPELALLSNGVEIAIPPGNNNVLVKARILNGTCDMPAKACFLNFVSYNGYHGCTACIQRGERTPTNRHVYRYEHNIIMRSDVEIEEFAEQANQMGEPFCGVKDLTVLSRLTEFPVTGTAIDPMHKYSGMVKKLMTIWFSSEYHNHPASISQMVRLVDERLCNIAPPVFVERLPRSLTHLKYFKVSELKLFLFSYSIPILHDLLPAHYFEHFKLLVHGLFLLNQASISPDMIRLASELLREFVSQFEDWYGVEHMTCNVHQLLHLSTFTQNLGPLFVSSCAPFESMNGVLKRYVHGTRYAELQVCSAASLYLSLSVLQDRDLRQDGPVYDFCDRISKRQKRLKLVRVTETVSAADKLKLLHPVPAVIINALQDVDAPAHNVHIFKKVYFKRRLFIAQSYLRAKKTQSFCVKFRSGNGVQIGLVKNFLRVSACECRGLCNCPASCFAIVNLYEAHSPFSTRAPRSLLSYIHECTLTDSCVAVKVDNFVSQCFHVVVSDVNTIFVVEPVNNIESDD